MPQITELAARAAVQTGLTPQQASANYLRMRSAANEVVGQTICRQNGFLDGREGTHGRRAPTTLGGNLEIQYLRGFAEGSVERAKALDKEERLQEQEADQGTPAPTPSDSVAQNMEPPGARYQPDRVGAGADTPEGTLGHEDSQFAGGDTPSLDSEDARETEAMIIVLTDDDENGPEGGDDPDDEPILPSAVFPPVNPPAPRPARHFDPLPGDFFANALPGIRLPEGTDCHSIAGEWHPQQRAELLSRGPTVAWVRSERQVTPASVQLLAVVAELLGSCELKNQPPLSIVKPYAREDGTTPKSVAIIGTEEQIRHLTSIGTWVTPLACLQIFPNRRIPPRLVGTFGGLPLELYEFRKVGKMVKSAFRDSIKVCEFLVSLGVDLEDLLDTLQLECVRVKEDGRYIHLWNILLAPPTNDVDKLDEWRAIVTTLCPRDPLIGQLRFCARPFLCKTCGCIRHPTGLCPTISSPDWLGFIPCSYTQNTLASHHGAKPKSSKGRQPGVYKRDNKYPALTNRKTASVKNAAKYSKLSGKRARYFSD